MTVDPVTLGAKLALTAMSYAMAPKIEGPRLKTLEVTVADYGTPFPEVDGYCRIDGCPVSWAPPLREKKVESKTKGGKFADYKYFFTCFVVAAGHEVDGIPRIWMDRHLVFDLTRTGPISVASGFFTGLPDSPVKLFEGRNMRIYLGTETQPIDPVYEEWCEDRYGPDSATARRGTAGAMFENIPAEKFGNRIPQFSMAVVNDPDPAYLHETFTASGAIGPSFSADRTRALFYDTSDTDYAIWDVPSQTKLIDGSFPVNDVEEAAIGPDGRIWIVRGTLGDTLALMTSDGQALLASVDTGTNTDTLVALGGHAYLRPYAGAGTSIIKCNAGGCGIIDVSFTPTWYFEDLDGNHWAIGFDGGDTVIHGIDTGDSFTNTIGTPGHITAFVNDDGNFFVMVGTMAAVVDYDTGTILDSLDIGGAADEHRDVMRRMPPGSASFWTKTKEIDASTLDTLQTYSMSSWTSGNTDAIAYEPITHSIWGRSLGTGTVTIRYLDRISEDGVTLGSIIAAKALRRGIPADAIDVSELTQPVLGYWTIQGSGAEQIGPLLDIHDVDATQHDYGLYFRTRGDASDALIDSSEFHANDGQRFDISMVPESRIPARVEFNYADNTADQQPNTASDTVNTERSGESQNKKVFDLTTYVDVPDDAQPKVNRYARRQWFEREIGEATLDITYGRLEPGDVKTIDIDGEQRVVRFTELTRSGLLVQAKWVRDDPRVHDITAQAGPTFDGRDEDVIYVTTPTKAVVMDIPFLNDEEADDRPLLHYGAGNYGGGNWPGAIIWDGDFESGNYEQWNAVDSADRAAWGYTEDALGDVSSPWCWDRGNSIVVQLKGGTLTSATEAEINADPTLNQAVIGAQGRWEIVNFTTATLLGSDRWEISGFRRGRRGTEWAIPDHAAGDEFWLASDLNRDSYGLSSVGLTEDYKGQTLGRDPVGSPIIDVVLEGQSLKPYAPANLTAERDFSTGNWTITGTRRTRIGGAWVGGTPIPLSEASEAYDLVILDSDGEEVRELTVTIEGDGNFSATYSSSDQVADFGSVQSVITIKAYQLSDAVGRGFPATLEASATGEILTGAITAGAVDSAQNATVTPNNPTHTTGDTLLCVAITRGTGSTLACATTGWTAADGITNPTTMNESRMWLFQNEADSDEELDPVITVSGGSSATTVMAVVLRIPARNTGANFVLGTVSANASNNNSIRFAQDSPSIDDGNAIIAIGVKNNDYIEGGQPGVITGITAGLDWTELVDFKTILGSDMTFTIDYAINDSGSPYTAGTGGVKNPDYSVSAVSAGVYLEAPLL